MNKLLNEWKQRYGVVSCWCLAIRLRGGRRSSVPVSNDKLSNLLTWFDFHRWTQNLASPLAFGMEGTDAVHSLRGSMTARLILVCPSFLIVSLNSSRRGKSSQEGRESRNTEGGKQESSLDQRILTHSLPCPPPWLRCPLAG